MGRFRNGFRKSYFIVNRIYLFIIFIFLALQDFGLGFCYFFISLIILGWKTLRSRVPIEVDKDFKSKTFIYKHTENRDLKLDLWLPLRTREKYPLVFFCHGGGWISGFRNQPNNVSWCKYLASRGLAVVSIDYRYGYRNNMEDILSDYTDALDYVRNNHEKLSIDNENIVLMGLSAGGHLSLLYSTYYTRYQKVEKIQGIKGVVAYYSPTDLNDIFISETKSIFAKFATMQTLKGSPTKKEDIYKYYSPIHWISPRMVPSLIVHGKLDVTVPFKSSVKFVKELKKLNVKCTFIIHKKGIHSFDTKFKDIGTVNALENTVRFIKKSICL